MQSLLGGVKALQYLSARLDLGAASAEDVAGVLAAAIKSVTKLAEQAVRATAPGDDAAVRADHVLGTRNNVVWDAVQVVAADRAGPGRESAVRRAVEGIARSAHGTPEPAAALRLLDAAV